jgi:hypothetical protein
MGPYTRDELGQFAPTGTEAQKKQQTTARQKKLKKLHELQGLLKLATAANADAGTIGLLNAQIKALFKPTPARRATAARRATGSSAAGSRLRGPVRAASKPKAKPKKKKAKAKKKKAKPKKSKKK